MIRFKYYLRLQFKIYQITGTRIRYMVSGLKIQIRPIRILNPLSVIDSKDIFFVILSFLFKSFDILTRTLFRMPKKPTPLNNNLNLILEKMPPPLYYHLLRLYIRLDLLHPKLPWPGQKPPSPIVYFFS